MRAGAGQRLVDPIALVFASRRACPRMPHDQGPHVISGFPRTFTLGAADSGYGTLTVNRIGFGAMRLTGTQADGFRTTKPLDRRQAIAVLRRARELGVNHVDTAAFHICPIRSANELVNSALGPYADDLV